MQGIEVEESRLEYEDNEITSHVHSTVCTRVAACSLLGQIVVRRGFSYFMKKTHNFHAFLNDIAVDDL